MFAGGRSLATPVPDELAPSSFVDRPALTAKLLLHLVSEVPAEAGRAEIICLYGMGGIGKTTVARWLVWRPAIEARFPDGRIWVTLGRQPADCATVLTNVLRQLRPEMYSNLPEDAVRAELAAILQSRAILIVIDDVWTEHSAEVARALLVASPRSRFLVTTRSAKLAIELGGANFLVDEMTDEEVACFVTASLGRTLIADEPQYVARLQSMVHGHPLALELAIGRLRAGTSWSSLLEGLGQESRRLETLDESDDDLFAENAAPIGQHGIRASLLLSVRLLSPKGQSLFAWLGTLDEDAAIDPRAAATLWTMEVEAARRTLGAFAGAGLLKTVGDQFRMHDLLRDLAIELLGAPSTPTRRDDLPGLGLSPAAAAAALLDRYRACRTRGLWHTLPDDGYIHEHLVRLFDRAGAHADTESLLWEEDAAGKRCGWYSTRELLGQTAGFLADVNQIWTYADRMGASGDRQAGQMIGLQMHCALIMSTINSLSRSAAPEVFAAAVRYGLMSLAVAIALVEQGADAKTRAADLIVLAREAPAAELPALLRKIAPIIRGVSRRDRRMSLLADLSELAPESERSDYLAEALASARAGSPSVAKVRTLLRLAALAKLSDQAELRGEALEAARLIIEPQKRAIAIAGVAAVLPDAEKTDWLAAALDCARTASEPADVAIALARICDHLPAESQQRVLADALNLARLIGNAGQRARALGQIAARLPDTEQPECVQEILAAIASHGGGPFFDEMISEIAEVLPPDQAYAVASKVRNSWASPDVLAKAVVRLPPHRGLELARTIEIDKWRGWALATIAHRLPDDERVATIREALQASRIGDVQRRSEALSKVLALLPPERALEFAHDIPYAKERVVATAAATGRLPLPQSMATASQYTEPELRAQAIWVLAKNTTIGVGPDTLGRLWALAQSLEGQSRLSALIALARHIPAGERATALVAVLGQLREMAPDFGRTRLLLELASLLEKGPQSLLLEEILAIIRNAPDYEILWLDRSLVACVQALPPETAIDFARKLSHAALRAKAILGLAAGCDGLERARLLAEVLAVANTISDDRMRRKIWTDMIPLLPPDQALALARRMWVDPGDGNIFAGFLGRDDQDRAFAELAPRLPDNQGLQLARQINDANFSVRAFAALAAKRARFEQRSLLDEALTLTFTGGSFMQPAIEQLAPVLASVNDPAYRYSRLVQLLRNSAKAERAKCAQDLAAALVLIENLGGQVALASLTRSFLVVGVWWP